MHRLVPLEQLGGFALKFEPLVAHKPHLLPIIELVDAHTRPIVLPRQGVVNRHHKRLNIGLVEFPRD